MRLENGAWKLRVGAGAEPQRASDSEPRPGALNHPHIASAPAFPHTHTLSQCLDHRHTTDSFPAMASGGMSAARGMSALFRPGNMASAMRLRAGAGLPVGVMESPSSPLPENAELIWDDGSAFPEPCLDNVAPMVGKYEALAWTMGGMGLFAGIAGLAAWNDKASKIPFAPREYPYDGLRVELGKEPC